MWKSAMKVMRVVDMINAGGCQIQKAGEELDQYSHLSIE